MTLKYNCEGNGEVHLDVLKAICGDTVGKSMIDICCGFAPQTRQLGFSNELYIDKVVRDLGDKKMKQGDILIKDSRIFEGDKYDVLFILDAIEHFVKKDGYDVLKQIQKISSKQIVFTPLGDYIIEAVPTDNPDSHKSGWLPQEFEDMGWGTIVFPNFHPTLNIGAFFAFKCDNLEQEFERVKNELNNKSWATQSIK